MNKLLSAGIILVTAVLFVSCQKGTDAGRSIVTNRIQYDVPIYNGDQEMDWWVQNIEGSNREKMVKDIIRQVSDGKVKAYEFLSYTPYTAAEIKNMIRRTDTISVERSTPPYDLVDTVLVTEIRLSDIKKIRFLEEWSMNEKTLEFSKKIAGICPLAERHTDSGEFRGYKPLFWVFFDEKYPEELKLK
jgi:hypothetical protein